MASELPVPNFPETLQERTSFLRNDFSSSGATIEAESQPSLEYGSVVDNTSVLQLPSITTHILEELESEHSCLQAPSGDIENVASLDTQVSAVSLTVLPPTFGHPGEDCRADNVQSAPTDMECGAPFQGSTVSAVLAEEIQQASCSHGTAVGPARLLNCKEGNSCSLQEQFSSLESSITLNNTSDCQVRHQNSNINNFETIQNFDTPFPQDCSKIPAISATNINDILTISKKFVDHSLSPPECNSSEFSQHEMNLNIVDTANSVKYRAQSSSNTNNSFPPRDDKKMYSKVLAPPNVVPSTSGTSPECGVMIERIQGFSLDAYAWAVSALAGKASVAFIGRDPRDDTFILVFLRTPEMAELLVNKGIWLKNKWLNVSFFQQPAVRFTVSGVLPFLPDSLVIEAFTPFGSSVYPILRKIPAAVRNQAFKGACSFRREIYIVKKERNTPVPDVLSVSFLGVPYILEVSTVGARCFGCGSLQHMVNKCKSQIHDDPKEPVQSLPVTTGKAISEPLVDSAIQVSVEDAKGQSAREKTRSHSSTEAVTGKVVSTRDYFTQCSLVDMPALVITLPKQTTKKKNECIQPSNLKSTVAAKARVYVPGPPPTGMVAINGSNESHNVIEKAKNNTEVERQILIDQSTDNGALSSSVPKKAKKYDSSVLPSETCEMIESMDFSGVGDPLLKVISYEQGQHVECNSRSVANPIQKGITVFGMDNKGKNLDGSVVSKTSPSNSISEKAREAVIVAEDWCLRSKKLKTFPRKKLAAQFLISHPNLESLLTIALDDSKRFPASSAKYKKIQELMVDIKQPTDISRNFRSLKRKQTMVDPLVEHS